MVVCSGTSWTRLMDLVLVNTAASRINRRKISSRFRRKQHVWLMHQNQKYFLPQPCCRGWFDYDATNLWPQVPVVPTESTGPVLSGLVVVVMNHRFRRVRHSRLVSRVCFMWNKNVGPRTFSLGLQRPLQERERERKGCCIACLTTANPNSGAPP